MEFDFAPDLIHCPARARREQAQSARVPAHFRYFRACHCFRQLFYRSVWGRPAFAAYPFTLGVTSGEPEACLRRRSKPNGGWRPTSACIKGVTIAPPELGHSAHVEIIGLRPARNYFYEFRIGVETSHIGRAHTLPFSRGYRRSGRASETWDVNATKTASS